MVVLSFEKNFKQNVWEFQSKEHDLNAIFVWVTALIDFCAKTEETWDESVHLDEQTLCFGLRKFEVVELHSFFNG